LANEGISLYALLLSLYALLYLYTEVNEYTAEHMLHVRRVHARILQKIFCFNYSVWMNTVCHTAFAWWHICAVEEIML